MRMELHFGVKLLSVAGRTVDGRILLSSIKRCSSFEEKILMNKLNVLFLPLFIPSLLFAQLFTKVSTGPVVSTPGDSRSVNFIDVNNDGWEDLFITNGPEGGATNYLYLNNGDGTFTAVSGGDIVTTTGSYDGATFADYDNDGDADGFVVTWWGQKNHFFQNEGNGAFTEDISIAPALPNTYSETASWGDYDNDGWLDLYVSNSGGDLKNLLYHNNGDGTFTKISTGAQSTDAFTSRGVTWIDFDLDGDEDLYVANEAGQANNFYRNNGDGTFTKITTGPEVSDSRSTMSASWGDIDNDGDPDLYTTNSGNFVGQQNQLYINNGDGTFTEVTTGDAVTDIGCSFSSAFEDYDNDGDLDLVVSNGFCNGNILNFLYLNDGAGNFTRDLSSIVDLSTPCSYGVAWGDVNNDGFPDLCFATCNNNNPFLNPKDIFYLNNGNGNHWLKVKLEGTTSNRSAIGAKVRVKATINGKPVWQYREVTAQSGYCSQNSMIVHFGLGNAATVDSLIIKFLGGGNTTLANIPVDQQLFVKEGSTTGIPSVNSVASLQCFPNPAKKNFSIALNVVNSETVTLRLMNVSGVVISEKEVAAKSGENLFQWNSPETDTLSGIYFLEASGKNWKQRTKIAFQ